MKAADGCRAAGGICTWGALRRWGVTRADLQRALAGDAIVRVTRGIYCLPEVALVDRLEFVWQGQRTCVTALREWGLPYRTRDSRLHLAIPHDRTFSGTHMDRARNIRFHWTRGPLKRASTVIGALDTAALCLSDVHQLAAIDAALNRGLINVTDLALLTITPKERADWLRDRCDPACQSPPETATRVGLVDAGLPVRSQVNVPGVGRVDFVVDGDVVVEVDGKSYHMNERSFWDDRRRDRVAQLGGMLAMRFTREDVERDLEGVVESVRGAVAVARQRRGVTGSPPKPARARRWTRNRGPRGS